MGVSNENDETMEMGSVRGSRDEENLPLYSEVETTEPPTIPDPDATPDTVREFFKNLLVARRRDSPDEAETIAARWVRGSGRELKSYPPAMYLKIFGPEDGWSLYKETQLILRRDKDGKESKMSKLASGLFLIFMIALEVSMIAIITSTNIRALTITALVIAILGAPLVILAMVLCFESSLEDQIESELRKCMQRGSDEN